MQLESYLLKQGQEKKVFGSKDIQRVSKQPTQIGLFS